MTASADVDQAGFRPDAGTISKPASKRSEATHSATAPSKRAGKGAGQTGRAARTPAVQKGAAGRAGRPGNADHKPVEASAPEQHAAAVPRGGVKRKRAPSAEPPAAHQGKQGRAAPALVDEPAQKRGRAAEKVQPAKQGKPAAARRGAKAAATDAQVARLKATVQPPDPVSVPASVASADDQPSRAAQVAARPAAPARAKAKPRRQGADSEQAVVPEDAAQTALAPLPDDTQPAVADAVHDASEPAPMEPAAAIQAAEDLANSPRKRGRVPSKRIAALQGSPGPEDAPMSHKRAPDPGSGDVPRDSGPPSPRGPVKSRAKRSKRQQLDDEVIKAKYMADLKQYVEERGASCERWS